MHARTHARRPNTNLSWGKGVNKLSISQPSLKQARRISTTRTAIVFYVSHTEDPRIDVD